MTSNPASSAKIEMLAEHAQNSINQFGVEARSESEVDRVGEEEDADELEKWTPGTTGLQGGSGTPGLHGGRSTRTASLPAIFHDDMVWLPRHG